MQINNNYAISQPRFGNLDSIKIQGSFLKHPEAANVIKAFKKSETLANLCESNRHVEAGFAAEIVDDAFSCLDLKVSNENFLPARAFFLVFADNIKEALQKLEKEIISINIDNLLEKFPHHNNVYFLTPKENTPSLLEKFGKTVDSLLIGKV